MRASSLQVKEAHPHKQTRDVVVFLDLDKKS